MKNYTLKEAEKQFGISARKMAYLIRKHIIEPVEDEGKLLVSEVELKRYLSLPKQEKNQHHVSFLKTLGPGLITGASDDDPSGIGTYSTVGTTYGLSLSWLALYLLPMMTAIQETVARIGIVTEKGLAGAIGKHYGRKVLYPLIILLVIANTVNIGADIGAMVASFQLIIPINFYIGAIVLTLGMILLEVLMPYHKYAKILKWLTLSLAAYIVTGFIIRPDWLAVLRSLAIPKIQLNAAFIAAMVAVMGTTITPYLFFWQASEEVEEERDKKVLSDHQVSATKREIKEMRKDTFAGMAIANVVFLFIIIVTAFVLHDHGITNIQSAADAAAALKPLAGNFASLLFTIGIFGVGLLAVPVLAGASAYAIAELFKWREGLNRKYSRARGFYGVIIISMLVGLGMNFVGINPIRALYYAAILNGIIAPILMFFIFKIGRDKKIMGQFTNPRWVNIWGWIVVALMGISAIALFVFMFLGSKMIGILDSGVGGLGVLLEIEKLSPKSDIVYFSDSANFPYGDKSESELEEITERATARLVNEGANTIVIACNSATVSAINHLRSTFPRVQFVGIEPAIKVAASCPSKRIGLMATARTNESLGDRASSTTIPPSSRVSKEALLRIEGSLHSDYKEIFRATDSELISTIENNYDKITDEFLRQKFSVFTEKGIDCIVLGCTHFYFIKEDLQRIFPDVTFFEPAEAVAKRALDIYKVGPCKTTRSNLVVDKAQELYYVTGDKQTFSKFLSTVLHKNDADITALSS